MSIVYKKQILLSRKVYFGVQFAYKNAASITLIIIVIPDGKICT